jgi:transposase-like protein
MSKSSFTSEQKIRVCTEYLSCKKSAVQLAAELNMGKHGRNCIREWVAKYSAYGSEAFDYAGRNAVYSKEFKERVVKEYLTGFGSLNDLCVKYKIRSNSQLRNWIMKYNNHMELKDYDPKPEVYMKDTLKTTYEERIEIVKDCLANDRNIKGVAAKYGCKYAQLYQWVRKYEANGEEALADKRGRRKQEDELSDFEKAERKITRLEREKEEYRMKYELLKKAEERERW